MKLGPVAICGPTAAGKTATAVALAKALMSDGYPCEIVNADSMYLYRGMDIGTAKPGVKQQDGVVHHLIDVLDITQAASVALIQQLGRNIIDELLDQQIIPLVVGGSALYLHAILDEFEFPPTDEATRAKYESQLLQLGPNALHAKLAEIAPQAAAAVLPNNGRRIVRALEILELGGTFTGTLPPLSYHYDHTVQFGLKIAREAMDAAIAARVHKMWQDGFVAEVTRLAARGLAQAPTASRALGYQQILAFLAGTVSEQQAIADTITGTRKFSRKQLMWYRRDNRIIWFDYDDNARVSKMKNKTLVQVGDDAH